VELAEFQASSADASEDCLRPVSLMDPRKFKNRLAKYK
jgi:hypothetical protein